METKSNLILAIYPSTFGIGYVICENPRNIIDFGLKKVRPRMLNKYMRVVKWLFEIAKPDVVIMRDYTNDNFQVSKRTRKVLDEIVKLAKSENLRVYPYSRTQIRDVFETFNAMTKFEIAKKLVYWYPQLSSRMPSYRKIYMAEDYHMAVFDAFALTIAHFHLSV